MDHSYPKAARVADRARIVELDAEIDQLQARIRVLQMERQTYYQRLDACRYPVLTLPNEIVSEIFLHFLPPYPTCSPLTGPESPTSLTGICRKWREIALATPQLWRAFPIDCADNWAEQLLVVQTWLDRSGSCPLSIELFLGPPMAYHAFVAILQHRERWQHVQLELSAKQVSLIEGPMPLLESLDLSINTFNYTKPTTSVGDFLRLRSVTLDAARHGNWLPVSQLTTLTFEGGDLASYYLPLLRNAANLVRLHLIDCYVDIPLQDSIKLARLETLVVFDTDAEDAPGRMLGTFTLPKLHTLRISGKLLGLEPSTSLTPFISRSGCQLQEVIVLGEYSFSQESFRATFPSIPNITFDGKYNWYAEEKQRLRDAF